MSIPNFVYARVVIDELGCGVPQFKKVDDIWQVHFIDPETKGELVMPAENVCKRTVKIELMNHRAESGGKVNKCK